MTRLITPTIALVLLATSALAEEELRFAGIFTDHAVLQREQPIPIWGFAKPGTEVQVTFADQEKTATTDKTGRWQVRLDPVPASEKPLTISAESGGREISLQDVLIGEVWLCSGQSNMAMIVNRSKDPEKEKADADLPALRVFKVDRKASPEPMPDLTGSWAISAPETAGRFSATAFFFGREIHRKVGVPVGLIVSAWSGSAIEAWTSRTVQEQQPALQPLLSSWAEKDAAYTPEVATQKKEQYEKKLAEWRPLRDAAVKAGKEKPRPPRRPLDPRLHHHHPCVLYNGMIAPLIPYSIRGAIWYQGETNGLTTEAAELYETQLPLLVNDWRSRWNQGDFAFGWMQLPTVSANSVDWAPVREAMRRANETLPNTGMAVTMDLGEERLLHPLNKQAFAHRLALWARAQVYGETDLAWSGPLPKSHQRDNGKISVAFDHTETGLRPKQGEKLTGFELQNSKHQWHPAEATIESATVTISHPSIANPEAVRYAWGNHPQGNLINAAGLPASPFQLGEAKKTAPPARAAAPARRKSNTPPPTKPPLKPVDIKTLPDGMERLDLYLLMGQSNMKGRGTMPEDPLRDPQIVMMHRKTDEWFLARHPLHLVGDPETFKGHDNAGVGPGLAFGQAMAKQNPKVRIGLIPCAVGGTPIRSWQPGAKLFEDTIRRARLALETGPQGKSRLAGAIWLQGEADSKPERIPLYSDALNAMIDNLRSDLGEPELPFVATTILELRSDGDFRKSINDILLSLPERRKNTACVNGRDIKGHIGDMVHIDTPSQNEIGRRFAEQMRKLQLK
ncbi:MAG: sialate O-acetylesterase [Verrucomicrobiales bacterium]|nr:sialate O-acetylesterase [Verrucomicrobiales bacterium]